MAPSITSHIPGMERGKPAGVRCVHLTENRTCGIYQDRPAVCREFTPTADLCGESFAEAMENLERLERLTAP